MRLSHKTNLYFTILALLVFAAGGVIFYYQIRHKTQEDADERLKFEKEKVDGYLKLHGTLPPMTLSFGDSVSFKRLKNLQGNSDAIKDTILYSTNEQESEPYRMYAFVSHDTAGYIRVSIFKPLIETDDLVDAIIDTLVIISIILVLALVVANSLMTKKLWQPFYKILHRIEAFDLTKESKVEFEKTSIAEFNELKQVLEKMTDKISSDYKNLKEFTENASHELQTPLSIIQSKIELLIQSENLSVQQMAEVQSVYEAAGRLSRLNQALLLLTKIENRQFADTKQVALNEVIKKRLEIFDDLIKHKNLNVSKHLETVSINIHPALADILLSNLIGNAIKHNEEGGTLKIELAGSKLTISNSGKPLNISPDELFQRFRKADGASESLGLGLAIVKEICNAYGYSINYTYSDNLHSISVLFGIA